MEMEWIQDVSFDRDDTILLAEVSTFREAAIKQEDTGFQLTNRHGHEVGWIRYDWDDQYATLNLGMCVVLGRRKQSRDDCYGLVVEPVGHGYGYRRVGICHVKVFHLHRSHTRIRVV
jgi:hypothetical protein